jgi:hypothetical protein
MPMKWSSVPRIKSIAGVGFLKRTTFTAGEIGDQIVNRLEQAAMRAQLQDRRRPQVRPMISDGGRMGGLPRLSRSADHAIPIRERLQISHEILGAQ